jgi:hypothetical protein
MILAESASPCRACGACWPWRLAAVAWLLAAASAHAASLDIDVAKKYGAVSLSAINAAIGDARRGFAVSPNDIITLRLPAGVFTLTGQGGEAASIDVSGISPGPAGRLILRGAGSDRTTLVFDTHHDEIFGRNTSHVSFIGLHFTTGHMSVSQGIVETMQPGAVVLRIADGFPTPAALFNPASDRGRYVRRCTQDGGAPHIDQDPDNVQIPWSQAEALPQGRWRLAIRPPRGWEGFRPGDVLAIKSKADDGNAYRFLGGDDVVFDDVIWSRLTRGVFRGVNDVKILNATILRDPPVDGQVPCLSSAAGGPQIGQPRDPPTTGNIVQNFNSAGTGDDALAFFNASGSVSHVTITDSFARGILLYHSPGVALSDIHVERAPVLRQ